MSTTTPNLGLVKPAGDEYPNIGILNGNSDKLDAAIGDVDVSQDGSLQEQVSAIKNRTSPNVSYTTVNDNVSYRIKNGICFVRLYGRTSSSITSSGLLIGTMPAGARTNDRLVIPFNYDSYGHTGQAVFDTNGNITAYCGVDVSQLYALISYPV